MSPLNSFNFSQGNLQDFVDCPRRFELRYLRRLAWPAVESEPVVENERRKLLGERFHRLVQQKLLCLPEERLEIRAEAGELADWWQAFLACEWSRPQPGVRTYPEILLTSPFASGRLVAKYDLLMISEGPPLSILIVDWKTSRHLPRRSFLMQKLQTRVYPYLIMKAGSVLAGGSFLPAQVDMVYWYPAYPDTQHRFPYSQEQFEQDDAYLLGLVEQIEMMTGGIFPMIEDNNACLWCTYRSLCDRGMQAGDLDDLQALSGSPSDFDDPINFNFDSIEPAKSL
jgi:hypothetical protein